MKRKVFDKMIVRIWGTSINPPSIEGAEDWYTGENEFKEYEDKNEEARTIPDIEDTVDAK